MGKEGVCISRPVETLCKLCNDNIQEITHTSGSSGDKYNNDEVALIHAMIAEMEGFIKMFTIPISREDEAGNTIIATDGHQPLNFQHCRDEIALPPVYDAGPIQNTNGGVLLGHFRDLRIEMANSNTARNRTGILEQDQKIWLNALESMRIFVKDQLEKFQPIARKHSRPNVDIQPVGEEGI